MKHPEETWIWYGVPGHFICGDKCVFHLCTKVGPWLVSTVGEMKVRDEVDSQNVGCDRLYETMVFPAGKICNRAGCNCELPDIDAGDSKDFMGYNERGDAQRGHYDICRRWADITVLESKSNG